MSNCPEIAIDWTVLILALLLGHSAAWLFNWLVDKTSAYQEGYTWLLVVTGVSGTLALALLIVPWQYVTILLAFFGATGLPMAAGDIWRAKAKERRARQEIKEEALKLAGEVFDAQKR